MDCSDEVVVFTEKRKKEEKRWKDEIDGLDEVDVFTEKGKKKRNFFLKSFRTFEKEIVPNFYKIL